MTLSAQARAVLLLTAHLARSADGAKPLSPREWGRLALWLKAQALFPEQLLRDGAALLAQGGWDDPAVTAERIDRLLSREAALAQAVAPWLEAGLWIVTRADPGYPARLKQRLRQDAPPLLYGCGDLGLLSRGGLAIVGSRDADTDDLEYSRKLAQLAARQDQAVISGGARGIDETAMLAALAEEGAVVGVLADGLLAAAASVRYRRHLRNSRLALVSPFQPEAGFSSGNAMARNKHIYCHADAAVVARSGLRGGTWSGALENLRQGWVPLWVRACADTDSGNERLAEAGGRWLRCPLDQLDVAALADPEYGGNEPTTPPAPRSPPPETQSITADLGCYEFFLVKLRQALKGETQTPGYLAAALGLQAGQLRVWLKQAVAERRVEALSGPRRYRWRKGAVCQMSLFGEAN